MILAETVKATFKDASEKLTGYRKRDFMAKVTEDYFDGSARKAETVMGWNGAILDSVEAAIQWATNMTWKGIAPIVHHVETIYDKGIKVLPIELEQYHPFWQHSETLPKWDITIVPG